MKKIPVLFLMLAVMSAASGCKMFAKDSESPSASEPAPAATPGVTASPSPAPAPSWAAPVQNGGASGYSYAAAIVTDAFGNVYFTGNTSVALDGQAQHGGTDFFLTKYDAHGVRQWTVQDGSTTAKTTLGLGIGRDSSNNLYVAGYTNGAIDGQTQTGTFDLFLTKYDASGNRQWTVQHGVSGKNVYGESLAVDSAGNSYIVGYTNGALDGQTLHGSNSFFLTKYDASGVRQWTVENGGASNSTEAFGVALDPVLGAVYVAGYTQSALDGQTKIGNQDFFLARYSSSGAWQWTVEDGVTGVSFPSASASGVAVDPSGYVYVSGTTNGSIDGQTRIGTGQNMFLSKYDSGGSRQWTVEDGSPGPNNTNGGTVTVDASGNVYATGSTVSSMDGKSVPGTSWGLYLTRYSANGTRQWTYVSGPSGTAQAHGACVATDSAGNVYLTGNTTGALWGLTQKGSTDLFVAQFPVTGAPSF